MAGSGVERDVDDVASDAAWNQRARSETETERLDRNWGDLLQELRVVQTGVQLLTGLLLTVPFQARFGDLTDFQRVIYLATVSVSVTSTALLIAPVALHRLLFRRKYSVIPSAELSRRDPLCQGSGCAVSPPWSSADG